MSKGRKRKNTIKIKKRKTKKSKRRKNKDNIKAGMKLKRDSDTSHRYKPYEAHLSRLTDPIIILDSKTEFDGRESWRPNGDRGILKLYNVFREEVVLPREREGVREAKKAGDYLKLELREEDINGEEILRCTAEINSHKNKYDFLSQIRSTDSTKRGYGTNLLFLLAKAKNDKIVHNGVDYSEITIRDFLPEIFNPFRNLFHLSVTLWADKLLKKLPQFTLFEPFYGKELSDVVNILYNHNNSEEGIEKYGEDLAEKNIESRMADDVTELLEVMSVPPSEIFK